MIQYALSVHEAAHIGFQMIFPVHRAFTELYKYDEGMVSQDPDSDSACQLFHLFNIITFNLGQDC